MSSPRHAPESRFEYWRNRLNQAEQAIHFEKLTQWPEQKLARQSLNVAFLSRTGSRYMQRVSIKGKSVYEFHRKPQFGGLSVVRLIAHPEDDYASGQ